MILQSFFSKYKYHLWIGLSFCFLCLLPFGYCNQIHAEDSVLTAGERIDIRVALVTGDDEVEFVIDKGEYTVLDANKKALMTVEKDDEISAIPYDSSKVVLYINGSKFGTYTAPLTLQAVNGEEDLFAYEDNLYRGDIILNRTTGGICLINQLDIESYLYGVVGMEMSSSYPLEALKAQAVACRSYALSNLNPYGKYDVVAGTSDQAYGGYTKEVSGGNSSIVKAVDATAGQVLIYENNKGEEKILTAFFHANGGGYTESSQNAWGGTINPCLVGVASPYDSQDPNNYSWTVEFTADEVEKKIDQYYKNKGKDTRLGAYIAMEIETKTVGDAENPSGRVNRIIVSGADSTVYIDRTNIRSIFGLKSTKFTVNDNASVYVKQADGQANVIDLSEENTYYASTSSSAAAKIILGKDEHYHVRSADGVIELNQNQEITGDKIIFEGFGYGHGVGMSQAGARYMAAEGKNYEDILALYYNGEVSYLKTIYK